MLGTVKDIVFRFLIRWLHADVFARLLPVMICSSIYSVINEVSCGVYSRAKELR